MNQKGKVFSLIALSGAMLFSFTIIGKNFDFLGARAANFGEPIDSSITFQRDQTFKSLGDNKYSVKGITPNNTTIYAIIECSIQPASNFMAVFPALASSSISDTKINFSVDENGNEPLIFQKINKLNFTFDSGSAAICIASYNNGTYTYGNPINFDSGIDGPDSEFFTPNTELKIKGASGEDRQRFERKLKSLTLSFTCDYNYIPPVEHSVSAASTINGSIQLQQTTAFKDDEIKFSIIPDSGYYASSVSTSNPDVVPEPHDSYYSFVMPDSDIEVRASFEPVPEEIYNVSAVQSAGGTVNFEQSQYHPEDPVVFSVTTNNGYEIDSVTTDPVLEVSESDGYYSFIMPSSDVEVSVSYKSIAGLTLSGSFKTSYYVNESLDTTGLVVTVNYNDSSSKVVTDYSASANLSSTGTKDVTISYHGVTETYQITVVARPTLSSIDVTAPDNARSFYLNDEFSHEGIVVTANYSNGDKVDVSNEAVFTTPDMTTIGNFKIVNVSYEGKTASYYARVYKKVVSISLQMNEQPVFKKGANFVHDTVIVKANYNNSTTATVDTASFSLDGTKLDTIGDNIEVVVTYTEELAAGKPITVTSAYFIKVEESQDPEPEKFSGTFMNGTGEPALILQFNEDGTGSYTYSTSSSTSSVTFTYTKDSNTLNITYASGNKDNFGSKALFINSDEATATINSDGNVVAKIGNVFSSSNKTFTKQ